MIILACLYSLLFQARYVVIVPTDYVSQMALRLELIGCPTGPSPPVTRVEVSQDIQVLIRGDKSILLIVGLVC